MASANDIITLDNFASRMPKWAPDLTNHLYALVDMGSNGIRFSVSDLSPPRARLLTCLYRERAAISLFDALIASSSAGSLSFSSEVVTQVSQTLARFKAIAVRYGVPLEHISVFATEAMRKADNAASMLDAIRKESGLGVKILAPQVETLFGAIGARSTFTHVNGLFLDLGGGSVQMTYMNSSTSEYAIAAAQTGKSLPFGAAKLSHVLNQGEAHAQTVALSDLQTGMRDAFARLQQEFPALKNVVGNSKSDGLDIYLCGGGFRGYGSMLMHTDPIRPYPIPAIGAYTVDGTRFCQTTIMRQVNEEEDGKIYGMSNRRRKQFPAIATVVEALAETVPRIHTVTFCSGGNREGALLMKLPEDIRESSPLQVLHTSLNGDSDVPDLVVSTLKSALPESMDSSALPTVFTLGLGSLFASEIWKQSGESDEANSASVLYQATTQQPSAPGFTHLARAVLGLTLCFRWGANLGPRDKATFSNLRRLASRNHPEAIFWAEYIGAVASLVADVCPKAPETAHEINDFVSFDSRITHGKKKTKVQLTISLSAVARTALDPEDIVKLFKSVGKRKDDAEDSSMKVEIIVQKMHL
ncbi:Ppx/GppA phosphatase [Xylariaceae sp. FL0016]|nr:Ppx/GppA phosphatase [Xylariaceae sp. FL0016]